LASREYWFQHMAAMAHSSPLPQRMQVGHTRYPLLQVFKRVSSLHKYQQGLFQRMPVRVMARPFSL